MATEFAREVDVSDKDTEQLETCVRGQAMIAKAKGQVVIDAGLKISVLSSHGQWPFGSGMEA